MAQSNIRAVITAEDRASKVVKEFGDNVEKSSKGIIAGNERSKISFNQLLIATAGLSLVTHKMIGVIDSTVEAANREQAALTGLASITRAFKVDTDAATRAAESLASDGLLTIGDAALGLKNLLAAGFNLPQATKLMERFKDSAAFGKQSALSFGQAVTSATEGIKNGNSILVDNAGVTKNLSIILEEAGFSAQDLMRATTDAGVRQALFNGIIKETNAQVGDAARLTELFGGKQAQLTAQVTTLKARIGEALQPALAQMLETIAPLVEKFAQFASEHPRVVAAVLLITTAGIGLLAVLGSIGLAVTGLAPIFTAMAATSSGAMALVRGAVFATSGAVSAMAGAVGLSSLAFGGLVAAAGVAIYKIYELKNAFDSANRSITNTNRALDSIDSSLKQAEQQYRAGKITKERYNAILNNAYSGLPGRAIGGHVNANTPYMVGERGAELFVPDTAGKIVPNGASGGTVNINVNVGMYAGTEMEKRRMAQELMRALKDAAGANNVAWGM